MMLGKKKFVLIVPWMDAGDMSAMQGHMGKPSVSEEAEGVRGKCGQHLFQWFPQEKQGGVSRLRIGWFAQFQ